MYPKGWISMKCIRDLEDEWVRVFEARHGKMPCIQTEPHEDTLAKYGIHKEWVHELSFQWFGQRCACCGVVMPNFMRRCDMCGAPV